MLKFPITIWSMVWNDQRQWSMKVVSVLKYCSTIIQPDEIVLFSCHDIPEKSFPWRVVRIPALGWGSYNIFINRVVPQYINSDFAMSVHEDGFPINTALWDDQFLQYDYIGAPWDDGVVGNGGFSIESSKLMSVKQAMPFNMDDCGIPSDRLVCTTRKSWLEERGIRFAPFDLALKFSTEQVGGDKQSFGFHGRAASAEKYKKGWKVIMRTGREPIQQNFFKIGNRVVRPNTISIQGKRIHGIDLKPSPIVASAASNKKICIATTFDKAYAMGGATMIKTVKRYTNCSNVVFKIITHDVEVVRSFGEEHCHFVTEEIKSRYAGVKYSPELPASKYHTSWYRYEIFSFEGFDRVICIDSDCLCLEDISYLFSDDLNGYDLISVEDHIVSKCFTKYVPHLEAKGLKFDGLRRRMKNGQIDVQPALLVANPSIVNNAWYRKLLHFANTTEFTYSIDEGILNEFIYNDGLKIHLLPLEWDYQDLYEIHCPELPVPKKPIIVHCQESKPFIKKRADIDARMHKWHTRWWQEHLNK